MPVRVWVAVVFLALGAGLWLVRRATAPTVGRARRVVGGTAVSLVALAALLFLSSCLTQVSTKEFGVKTSFGRPVGSLTNGLHLKAPWDKVTEIDAAIQTDSHVQGEPTACLSVRMAHQIVACADVSIRWRIQDGAADALFQNYRDFDNIRASLVTRELSASLNKAFEDYDPLAVDEKGNSTAPELSVLSAAVAQQMQSEIGSQITVLSVIVPVLHFDTNTQGRLNALQAQIAQTRIADQAIQTATAQAQANSRLAASVSKDANVLVNKCYDLVSEMIAKGQAVPVGFSCWPNAQSSVVVPTTPGR
jgi:regulator of protease activity HflC (stomatin/prohibitin superfamily)